MRIYVRAMGSVWVAVYRTGLMTRRRTRNDRDSARLSLLSRPCTACALLRPLALYTV